MLVDKDYCSKQVTNTLLKAKSNSKELIKSVSKLFLKSESLFLLILEWFKSVQKKNILLIITWIKISLYIN